MQKDRFLLQPSQKPGFWVATDTAHNIVITFQKHRFNDTQKITLLDGDTFASATEATRVATYLRELADWLRANHYEVAMPPINQ